MVKLVEVCEKINASNSTQKSYTLREVYVSPEHVVSLREEHSFKQRLKEGVLPDSLDSRQGFTRITLDRGQTGLDIIVVGVPSIVEDKLQGGRRELLHG